MASPASINAIGEGNGELLVVALLAVSAKFAIKRNAFSESISLGSLVWASLLKLYPAVCFWGLVVLMRRRKWIPFFTGVLVAGWFLWTFADVKLIIERIPAPFGNGFGCEMLPVRAQMLLDAPWLSPETGAAGIVKLFAGGQTEFRVAFVLIVGGFFWFGYRIGGKRPSKAVADDNQALLLFGALLFIGAFGIGNSWNHRLLSSVPWLIAALYGQNRMGMTALFAASLWLATFDSEIWFLFEQTIFWVLLSVCAFEVGKVSHQLISQDGFERNDI